MIYSVLIVISTFCHQTSDVLVNISCQYVNVAKRILYIVQCGESMLRRVMWRKYATPSIVARVCYAVECGESMLRRRLWRKYATLSNVINVCYTEQCGESISPYSTVISTTGPRLVGISFSTMAHALIIIFSSIHIGA